MRVALVAPPWFTIPPSGYGGIELVVSLLAEGLASRGHDVTLFASAGSQTSARLVAPLDAPPDPSLVGNPWFDGLHAVASYRSVCREDFDVVHDHSGIVGPALGALLDGRPPVVHTLHGPWTEPAKHFYERVADVVHLVAISESQRRQHPAVRYAGVVHNGIDVARHPFCPEKDDFLVFVGRANPDKGPVLAIEVARRTGLPLHMIVKREDPFERSYWDEAVAPALHEGVTVHERVTPEHKLDLLSRARSMVFPIQWPEPFGLVMAEALACGTPVVACPVGAAEELVEDGVTGFLRSSLVGLVAAVEAIDQCSPAACRARVEARFSADAMVDGYERVYERVVEGAAEFPLSP